jgi:hypothetical protein
MEPTKSNPSSILRKILFGFLGVAIVALVITFLVFSFTYSEGSRAGVIIKFSKKGYVFKTYEGELNLGGMGNVPNTAQFNQIWECSVKDQQIADTLMGLEGRKVSLHYKEKIKNLPWQGETKYFVDGVEVLNE